MLTLTRSQLPIQGRDMLRVLCAAVLTVSLSSAPLSAASIITHWSFDNDFTATSGSKLNDATSGGSPTIVNSGSKIGGGHVNFNNNDDYLAVSPESDYELGSGQFSLSLWFRDAGSASSDRLLATGATINGEEGWAMFLDTGAGRIAGATGDGSARTIQKTDANNTADPYDGGWHHLVMTMDATGSAVELKTYLDGVLETTLAPELLGDGDGANPSIGNDLASLFIGGNGQTARTMVGDIDDLAVIDGLLTSQQVAAIWNGGAGQSVSAALVPEPTSICLLAVGAFGAIFVLRQRKRR